MIRRTLTLGLLLLVGSMLTAGPAAADPAGPTNYRSNLTGVQTPDGDPTEVGVDLEVLGGDAFLAATVPSGTVVEVPGYEGEPYVRIDADGGVHVNQRSPARWLNDARFGELDVEVPASADADAPPQWEQVASGGEYAWHDHRIHFMSPSLPSSVDPAADGPQSVLDWEVPVTIDDETAVFIGELTWVPGPAPVVPIAAVVLVTGAVVVLVLRKPDALGPLVVGASVLTAVVAVATVVGLPPGAEGEQALLVLPGMALAALAVGTAIRRRGDDRGSWLRDAAGIPMGVWAVLQFGALTRPIVPGPVPVTIVRAVTVVALAVGIAALVALVRRVLDASRLEIDPLPSEP